MLKPTSKFACVATALSLLSCGAETDESGAELSDQPDDTEQDDSAQPPDSSSGDSPSAPSATTGTIECTFYYRRTNNASEAMDPADLEFSEATLALSPNEEDTVTLGSMELSGNYSSSEFESASFHLRVTAGETTLFSTLYQLSDGLPLNQFAGDHGFTGLMYLTHPTEGGDYQLICKSVPE